MDWVLDASIALAWALPDGTSVQADQFLSRVSVKDILWVPSLWWYEVANALIVAERRKRITEAEGIRLKELYGMLPIKTDMVIGPDTIERLRTLAREYKLSATMPLILNWLSGRGWDLRHWIGTFDLQLIKQA